MTRAHSSPSSTGLPASPWALLLLFTPAIALPTLLAFNMSPSATVLNQIAAMALWGVLLTGVAWRGAASAGALARQAAPLLAALLCAAAAVAWSCLRNGLPASLALSLLAFIAAGLLVAVHGTAAASSQKAAGRAFFAAWVVAGVFSSAIAWIQVFHPEWADGQLIAHSGLPGRAVGNVRQPNHLAGLLLWSCVALVPLVESRRWAWRLGWPLFALFVFAIELSASRTGMIGVVLLAAWGVLDRRLARNTRIMLWLAPVVYAVGWYGMSLWAADTHHTFGAAARLAEKDVSGSRFGIWSDTLGLIRLAPWTGVGFGQFNFAWSLTPFPHRPVAFFDHTHNLVLQFIVELGLPLGLLVIGLLAAALWLAFRRSWRAEGEAGSALRAASVGVLLAAIHSGLEYPLWYGYFLLPTGWAWGYALGGQAASRNAAGERTAGGSVEVATEVPERRSAIGQAAWRWLRLAGVAMLAGSVYAVADYLTVSQIFDPSDETQSLDARIARGQGSVFFAYHADYAAATVAEHPSQAWSAFRQAPYYLLDTRLMTAWANAFAERGDLDRARHIAQRLREFHNPQSDEFFAPCEQPVDGAKLPFQCEPPSKAMDWRDFKATGD